MTRYHSDDSGTLYKEMRTPPILYAVSRIDGFYCINIFMMCNNMTHLL
jgi:hypothetical protein